MVHTALPQQRRQQQWRKWRSPAVLRSASTTQRPAFVANICRGGLSPRRRGSASARSCCLDHVPARQQVAPCRRCRRPARRARLASRAGQALASHGKGATSTIDSLSVRKSERGAAAGHGTRKCYCTELHSTKASLLSEVPARCPVETGGVADFAARSIDVCAARRRSNARSSRHAHAPACAAAPRPAKAASTAAVGSNNWARGLPF